MGDTTSVRVDGRLLQVERRSVPLEFRFAEEETGSFEGYLSIWDVTDSYGTRFLQGAYRSGGLDELPYPLLFMHDPDSVSTVIGVFNAAEDERGLRIAGQFAPTRAGQDARALAQMGAAPELSVGFVRLGTLDDDPNAINKARLVEGSLIVARMAATPGAEITSVRSQATETRAWPPVAGSHEERRWLLEQAARGWAAERYQIDAEDSSWWVYVEATFDDAVVVLVEHYSDPVVQDYWRFSYTLGTDGPELSEPTSVKLVSQVTSRSADRRQVRAADDVIAARAAAEQLRALPIR